MECRIPTSNVTLHCKTTIRAYSIKSLLNFYFNCAICMEEIVQKEPNIIKDNKIDNFLNSNKR